MMQEVWAHRSILPTHVCQTMYPWAIFTIFTLLLVTGQGLVHITSAPIDQIVQKGDDVTFSCTAGVSTFSKGAPTITWLRNGKPIKYNRKTEITENHNELRIFNADAHDTGTYTCVGTAGQFSNNASAVLIVNDVPLPPSAVELKKSCQDRVAQIQWKSVWDERLPVTGFIIEYNTSFTPDKWQIAKAKIPPNRQHDRITLSPWGNYSFRVIAQNRFGDSAPSRPTRDLCRTPPEVPHHNPKQVCTANHRPRLLIITWELMPEEEHNGPGFYFMVRWRPHKSNNQSPFRERIVEANENTLKLLNQPIYEPYEIYVQSYNQMGKAAMLAKEVIGHSGEAEPLEIPQNFRLNPDKEVSNTSADFLWDPVNTTPRRIRGFFRGYKIQFWKTAEGSHTMREHTIIYQEADPCGLGGRQKQKRDANSGHVYNLWPYTNITAQIRVLNVKYQGPPSNRIIFMAKEGVPGEVEDVHTKEITSSSMNVEWSPPAHPNGVIKSYIVSVKEVGRKRHKHPQVTMVQAPDATNIEMNNLSPFTTYDVTIWARTEAGRGPPHTVRVTTQPNVPELPKFSAISINGNQVNVSWLPSDGGPLKHTYTVEYRQLGKATWKTMLTAQGDTWILVPDVKPGFSYEVRIKVNNGHRTATSDPSTVTLQPVLGPTPLNFNVRYIGDSSLGLIIDDPKGSFLTYYIQYKKMGTPDSEWLETPVISRHHWTTLTNLTPGYSYKIRIFAITKKGKKVGFTRKIIAGKNQAARIHSNQATTTRTCNIYLSILVLLLTGSCWTS